jgi:hypothetical protein
MQARMADGGVLPGGAVAIRGSAPKAWVARIAMAGGAMFFGWLVAKGVLAGNLQQALFALPLAAAMLAVLYAAERRHAQDRSRGYVLRVDAQGLHVGDGPRVGWDRVRALELRSVRRSVAERKRAHLVLHVDAQTLAAVEPGLKPSLFGGDLGYVQHATSTVLIDASVLEYPPAQVVGIVRAAWDRPDDAAAAAAPAPKAAHA